MQNFAAGAGSARQFVPWDPLSRKIPDRLRPRSQASASNAAAASRNVPTKHSVLTIPVSFTTKKNWKKCMQEPAGNHLCIYRPGRFPGTGEGRLITGISTGILNFIRSGRNSRAGDHHAPHSFCLRAPLRPSPRIDSRPK